MRNIHNFEDFKVQGLWSTGFSKDGDRYHTRASTLWMNLETRCNPRSVHRQKRPSYEGCENHFKDFQHFAEWATQQYGYCRKDDNGLFWQLDKDFLGDGVYSETTCLFAPSRINNLLLTRTNQRGPWPLGVSYKTDNKKFVAQINNDGKRKHLGYFQCPQKAHQAWQQAKLDQLVSASEELDIGWLLTYALQDKAAKLLQEILRGEETKTL